MIRYQILNRLLWGIIALCALAVSLMGLLNTGIYQSFAKSDLISGLIAQDLISLLVAISLIYFSLFSKAIGIKKLVIILGMIGYLFYGYGIYVMELFYNAFYFVYMVIFGLSFYSIVVGIVAIDINLRSKVEVNRTILILSALFLFMNPLIFYPLWITEILPYILERQRPEVFYSVYILDLCLIMPAMVIVGVMALKNSGWALLLLPALLVWGFILLFAVALGGMIQWIRDQTVSLEEISFYLVLSLIFIGLIAAYFRRLKISF